MKTRLFLVLLVIQILASSLVMASVQTQRSNENKIPVIIIGEDVSDLDAAITKLGSDFELKHRYETFAGFSGAITKDGLSIIKNSERIQVYADTELDILLNESRRIIGADTAEYYGFAGRNMAACVIDTGVDYSHPSLGGCFGAGCRVVGGYDFANNDPDPMDDNGHGTHVAGIIASSNAVHRGVAPNSNIVAIKACTLGGSCWASNVIAGIDWCASRSSQYNIKVITMSLGGGVFTNNDCPTYMNAAIDAAHQRGLAVTAASGNGNSIQGIAYPACAPNVISVGATYDKNVGPFTWSGYAPCTDRVTGPGIITCFTNRFTNLDVLAPGAFITSTGRGSFYEDGGTSMAAPHVAGTVLLLKEVDPALSLDSIESLLKATGRDVYDPATMLTFKEISAIAALQTLRHAQSPCHANRSCI